MEQRLCNRCDNKVIKSELADYSYQCLECDEDLYVFETYIHQSQNNNFQETVKELNKIVPKENWKEQPITSLNEINRYEELYGISTFDFFNKNKDISVIPIEVQGKWINTVDTYFNFGGKITGINC